MCCVLQLLTGVLGDVKQSYELVAWPRIALVQRRIWSPAEDSLLWLGVIRCVARTQPLPGRWHPWEGRSCAWQGCVTLM